MWNWVLPSTAKSCPLVAYALRRVPATTISSCADGKTANLGPSWVPVPASVVHMGKLSLVTSSQHELVPSSQQPGNHTWLALPSQASMSPIFKDAVKRIEKEGRMSQKDACHQQGLQCLFPGPLQVAAMPSAGTWRLGGGTRLCEVWLHLSFSNKEKSCCTRPLTLFPMRGKSQTPLRITCAVCVHSCS